MNFMAVTDNPPKKLNRSKTEMNTILLVVSGYIAAQMMSDIASLKIIMLFGFSMDAGTLIYPITFTLRDMIQKTAGRKAARLVIWTAAGINILMACLFWLVSILPADTSAGTQEAFAAVLSPVWRIVFASIVAEVISELIDTEFYTFWVERITKRYQWARVLFSNAASVPIDSLAFCWLAFGGVMPASVVWSIFWANVILKGITTLISLPGIYLVKEKE